jgi:hypothetical protein
MTAPSRRAGSVLALAVLVLLALQLLAHGALLMARAEWTSSLAGLRLLQARAGADAGVLEVLGGPAALWDSIAPLQVAPSITGALGSHPFAGRPRRLSAEYWLVEGQGRSRGERWALTVRRLVWLLDARARIASVEGGAEFGGVLSGADVVSLDPERPPFCRSWEADLDTLASPAVWRSAARVTPSAAGEPALGRLGPAELAVVLPVLSATVGTPLPATTSGRCDPDAPWNWGDPSHPASPCGDRLVAWSAARDLLLEGGVGQGLLAVGGDLVLAGARFDGVLLVGGSLTLRGGAEARGMVRVGGDLIAEEGSRVLASPCRALRALYAFETGLRRPLWVAGAGVLEDGA